MRRIQARRLSSMRIPLLILPDHEVAPLSTAKGFSSVPLHSFQGSGEVRRAEAALGRRDVKGSVAHDCEIAMAHLNNGTDIGSADSRLQRLSSGSRQDYLR